MLFNGSSFMSRMYEIKARAIEDNPERKMTYDTEAIRLKTAVIVMHR